LRNNRFAGVEGTVTVANPAFNDDLDDYLNRRRDKGRLQRKAFWSVKRKQDAQRKEKGSAFFAGDDSGEAGPEEERSTFSLLSVFRRRIPSEEEVAKSQARQQAPAESAARELDSELQPQTLVVEDDYEDEEMEQEEPGREGASEEGQEPRGGQGFIVRLFGGGRKRQEEEEQRLVLQMQQQNIEDLKETIRVLHRWLEKLPPERILEFKRNPDFEKYKDGLRKLGLIRE
jgi:hypothetical protein